MTLTENQKKALAAIQQGAVTMRKTGYASWRIMGPIHPSVVGRVIALGLATWTTSEVGKSAALTDSGSAALAAPT
ncbi:hypothetical protein ACMAUO_20520 [Gluconacetobacter sp. Hr-1-5]|uniref:hypothetical protein n=1 Tax=Gluconacetobacter sp. Hr-1-5 TaxID=3395370 RepID=UPI003B51F598